MKKMIVHTQGKVRFISQLDINYCKSDNCYTSVFLDDGEEIIVCKSLTKIGLELDRELFIRINQSYLVNKECIKLIDKKNKRIELENNVVIPFNTSLTSLFALLGIKSV